MFYQELGPALLDATTEILRQNCLFNGMILAVARLATGGSEPPDV